MEQEEFIFENLGVYKKALSLSVDICKISSGFPIKYSRISGQFIGAIISIPLNIAEGSGRKTSKDKINFYKIARSSSFECIPIIEICFSLALINIGQRREFRDRVFEISKMLSGLISYQANK